MKEIVPGIYTWSWFSGKHGYNFNGYGFKSDDGLVVIDPATMESSDLEQLHALGTPAHIMLTNKDHERMAYELRDRFGAKIYIHEKDSLLIKFPPDHIPSRMEKPYRVTLRPLISLIISHLERRRSCSQGEKGFFS